MTTTMSLVVGNGELPVAKAQVRKALEVAGFVDLYATSLTEGFRVRGTSGGRTAAMLSTLLPPLQWFGICARTEIDVRCRRSLKEGDPLLHMNLRVGALTEFDDDPEVNFLTRGFGEIIGDSVRNRRVMERVAGILKAGVQVTPEEIARSTAPREERQAAFRDRLYKGRRRRNLQLAGLCVTALLVVVARVLLGW